MAATDNAIEIGNLHEPIGETFFEQSGSDGGAVTRNQPLCFWTTEDDAADGVDGDHLRAQTVLFHEFRTASQRAARAGGAEEIVDVARERFCNFAHGLVMSARVVAVRILV